MKKAKNYSRRPTPPLTRARSGLLGDIIHCCECHEPIVFVHDACGLPWYVHESALRERPPPPQFLKA